MALFKSDYRNGVRPVPVAQGAELVSVRAEYTTTASAAGDIFSMIPIPEDHILVDVILDADDLDSNGAPTITLSVAYLNATEADIDVTANVNGDGAAFIVASTIGQAGGEARVSTKSIRRALQRASGDGANGTAKLRNLGVKVVAGSATFQAGKLGLTAIFRSAHYGA